MVRAGPGSGPGDARHGHGARGARRPRARADFWAAAAGHPLMGPAARLLSAVDVFSLWGALLAGFGLAAAAQLPARRALIATLVAWMCYRLLATVAMGGHP